MEQTGKEYEWECEVLCGERDGQEKRKTGEGGERTASCVAVREMENREGEGTWEGVGKGIPRERRNQEEG